ncbi:MAG: hypothetical protein ACXWC4_05130 [Telluria sp.]
MRKFALAVFAVAPLLSGCAGPTPSTGPLFAQDFTFVVKNLDGDAANVYLNSRKDDSEPGVVTVAIDRHLLKELKARYGDNLESAFLGKTVHVQGRLFKGHWLFERNVDRPIGPVFARPMVVPRSADQIELI